MKPASYGEHPLGCVALWILGSIIGSQMWFPCPNGEMVIHPDGKMVTHAQKDMYKPSQ